jgi:hypothetical protein
MEDEFKNECERHKTTKDELAKTKSSLQYTRIQAAVGYMTELWCQPHKSGNASLI